MAEVLVKLVDATHTDPAIDQAGCYKAGMPVVVMPDGHPWGPKEGLPRFFVVKFPGVSVAQIRGYIQQQVRDADYAPNSNKILGQPTKQYDDNGVAILGPDGQPVVIHVSETTRVREWQFDVTKMQPAHQQIVMSTGAITVTLDGTGDATWEEMRVNLLSHRLGFTERRSQPRA